MIRPSSLYRSDSRRQPNIEANANNIHKDSIDCGISVLKCCNTPRCQKLGNKKTFLVILVLSGIIQGAIETYFRISAKQAAVQHEFSPIIIDWLVVSSGIFQGIFAMVVTYWGNRIHRAAWMGALFMLQAVMCLVIIVPTLAHHEADNDTIEAVEVTILCIRNTAGNLVRESAHGISTLILLFLLQFGIGMGNVAFFALGFSYLDDNVHEHESPGLLAAAFAGRFWGSQLGLLLSLSIGLTTFGWWLGWTFLSPILFIIGFLAVMFPKKLLSTVVRQAANNIIETATSSSHASLANPNNKFIADIGFFASLKRIVTNRILVCNVLAAVFILTAFINFTRHEANYLQSRFFLPTSEADGINNEWTSILVTNLLRPPMVALSILVAGLIIAKANPSARTLVMWNIVAASLVVVFFVTSIFIDCENSQIAGAHRGRINKPFCASSCMCSDDVPFTPVCPENGLQTFYSPCHAGCSAEIYLNKIRVFGNCSCGVDTEIPMVDLIATDGACGMDDCQAYWIAFQALSVIAAALLGSTVIGKLIISIRSVLPQDKSFAISFELCLSGLIIYIPGKLGYRFIADKTCQYFAPDNFRCFLHESPNYGNWLNILTAALILIGIVFEVLVFLQVKDLLLYGDDEPEDAYRPIEMQTLRAEGDGNNARNYNRIESIEPVPISPNTALLQGRSIFKALQDSFRSSASFTQPSRNNNGVTYAKIQHDNQQEPTQDIVERLNFRLQTPPARARKQNNLGINSVDNSSLASDTIQTFDHGSPARSVSPSTSGYVNIMPPRPQNKTARPLSPETDF